MKGQVDSNFGDLPDKQVVSGKTGIIKGHKGLIYYENIIGRTF